MKMFFVVLFSALIIATPNVHAEWTYENRYNVLHVFENLDVTSLLKEIKFSTTSKIFIELRPGQNPDDSSDVENLFYFLNNRNFRVSYVPYRFPALEVNLSQDGSETTDALVDALNAYEKFEPTSIIGELKSKLRDAALKTKLMSQNPPVLNSELVGKTDIQ